jgi:hypothetical protein
MTLRDTFAITYLQMASGQISIHDITSPDEMVFLAREAYLFAEVMMRFRGCSEMMEDCEPVFHAERHKVLNNE